MKTGIGQDSHKFLVSGTKPCVIGGVTFPDVPGLDADSDGDVVYHAICNAITSITHVPILGGVAIALCKQGVTDSKEYLLAAHETLQGAPIHHIALALQGKRPRMQGAIDTMRHNVASLLHIPVEQVGITCTSGNGMDDVGRGIGVACICIITIT